MSASNPVEFPIKDDLDYLHAAVPQLEEYLISDQPTWQVDLPARGRQAAVPLMSPGTLLLACARICPQRLPDQASGARIALLTRRREICTQWASAWRKKVLHDFETYAFLWKNLLVDYRYERDQLAYYPFEIHQRVVLDLMLADEPEALAREAGVLAESDALLKELLPPGDFLWEGSLAVCFPLPDYWYLYRTLR